MGFMARGAQYTGEFKAKDVRLLTIPLFVFSRDERDCHGDEWSRSRFGDAVVLPISRMWWSWRWDCPPKTRWPNRRRVCGRSRSWRGQEINDGSAFSRGRAWHDMALIIICINERKKHFRVGVICRGLGGGQTAVRYDAWRIGAVCVIKGDRIRDAIVDWHGQQTPTSMSWSDLSMLSIILKDFELVMPLRFLWWKTKRSHWLLG